MLKYRFLIITFEQGTDKDEVISIKGGVSESSLILEYAKTFYLAIDGVIYDLNRKT